MLRGLRQVLVLLLMTMVLLSCDGRKVKFTRAEYTVVDPSDPGVGCKKFGDAAFVHVGPTTFQVNASAEGEEPARASLGIRGIRNGTTVQFQSRTFIATDLQNGEIHSIEHEGVTFLEPIVGTTGKLNRFEALIYGKSAVHGYHGVVIEFPELYSTDWELQIPGFTIDGRLHTLPRIRFTQAFGVPHREFGYVCDDRSVAMRETISYEDDS